MNSKRVFWMGCIAATCVAAAGAALPCAPLAAVPLPAPAVWSGVEYDEPIGPYYSCGMTLDHISRDRVMIRKFHEYLAAQKYDPVQAGGANRSEPPTTIVSIVIDPEKLPADKLPTWGWKKEGTYLLGGAGDDGPTVHVPLAIPRAGTYLIAVRYWGSTKLTGLTGFKLYRRDKAAEGPLLIDEFNNQPAAAEGWVWHELVVSLNSGDYEIQMPHIVRQWHAAKNIGYGPRKIECIYLTDALWRETPDEAGLEAVRGGVVTGAQATQQAPMAPGDGATWKKWQLRPVGWERALENPQLFGLSYTFWREQLAALAKEPKSNTLDYRDPHRQIVFDDVWNMLGNPWRISEQITALAGDVSSEVKPARHYFKGAGQVDERTGGKECDWWPQADKVVSGTPYNFKGSLIYTQNVEPGHKYAFWVQFRDIGFFEPWQIRAAWQGNPTNVLHWKRDKRNYPPDIQPQRTWVKIGNIDVPAGTTNRIIRWTIMDLPWNGLYAVSYRWIHNFLITSDQEFSPKGTVLPATSSSDYLERAGQIGGRKEDGLVCQTAGDQPLPLDWWPGSANAISNAIRMPPDAFQSFQIGMRGVADEPVAVGVECSPLQGRDKSYPGRISWRVPVYVPYGDTRATWAAWCLLRRPFVTVPRYNVAGIYLQVDTHGVKPGEYAARITLTPRGRISGRVYPVREGVVKVNVSTVTIAPKKPVLVHGYTMPPEGEAYLQDYQAHGLKVWCGPILSKDEMRKRGMVMQQLRARASNGDYTSFVKSIKDAGLGPEDYYAIVWDEPSGTTEAGLATFINTARRLHELDPAMPRVFNPGEPAVLKTFQLLNPYCEIWMPYERHFIYHPNEAAAKTQIITSKPWMDYSTPCYGDKEPQSGPTLFNQIRRVPGARGQCLGTWFFALYYPFRDPWDTGNEFLRDTSVFVLPSAHGPVSTFAWEMVRSGIQTADLALMVKERAAAGDEQAQALIRTGAMRDLLIWLEK
ncbi:MAG: hypothetical protein WCL16_08395 [bacterium]